MDVLGDTGYIHVKLETSVDCRRLHSHVVVVNAKFYSVRASVLSNLLKCRFSYAARQVSK